MKTVICSKNAPAARGSLLPGDFCRRLPCTAPASWVWCLRPVSWPRAVLAAQARQMFANVKAVLAENGMDLSNVVKTTVFMTDLAGFCGAERHLR